MLQNHKKSRTKHNGTREKRHKNKTNKQKKLLKKSPLTKHNGSLTKNT